MREKGINILDLKKVNRRQMLAILRNKGSMSRKDIAKLLGLTPAAVTIITNEMIQEGILLEKGEQEEEDIRAGRKKVLIDINYDYKYVIGISVETQELSFGLCNLKGEVINTEIIKGIDFNSNEELIKSIREHCFSLLWKNNLKREDILGLGFGIVGPVDSREGICKGNNGLLRGPIELRLIIQRDMDIPVIIDNNVKTLAMAEMDLNPQTEEKRENIIFVKYGPGIGSAIVLNNEIYSGGHNSAGELGHTIVDYNGRECKCGKKGCLETVASENEVLERVKKVYSKENTAVLYRITNGCLQKINIDDVINSAKQGDESVDKIIREAAYYFSLALANAVSLYDPHKLVFYGKAFENEYFTQLLKEYMTDMLCQNSIELFQMSNIKPQEKFLGGAALALRKFFYNQGGLNNK